MDNVGMGQWMFVNNVMWHGCHATDITANDVTMKLCYTFCFNQSMYVKQIIVCNMCLSIK